MATPTTPAPSREPLSAPHASAPTAGEPVEPGREPSLALPRFYAALRSLSTRERNAPVRVLWLGDSHTAADYLPHELRAALASRFGAGGPGHLQVGLSPYRHGWATVEVSGTWERQPASPSRVRRQDDGVFGLGGLRFRPKPDARATVLVKSGAVRGSVRWTVLFRARSGARLVATLGDAAPTTLDESAGRAVPGSALRHVLLEGPPNAALGLSGAYRQPELFGVIAEASEPGVVVDTLGINGARVSTPLAWDEATFQAEVRERAPVLAVLAYGTNEAFDATKIETYAADLAALITRLERASAETECLVVGPPDAAVHDGTSQPRVAEIEAAYAAVARAQSCAFWSAREAMGGEGSFARWAAEKPPLARPDRVHLTPRGYERVGKALGQAILDSYDTWSRR